ncbi:calcium-binding protein, partial [Dolichospermum sp. ST_sed8]|nr:calcium-binding protein [Dolichospermum sp. ST_sed8]
MANIVGTNNNDNLPINGIGNGVSDVFSPLLGEDIVDGGDDNDILVINYSSNTYAGPRPGGSGPFPGIIFEPLTFVNGTNAVAGYSGLIYAYKDINYNRDSVTFSRIERFSITGTNSADEIRGGINNDTLNGLGGDDIITSGGGSDTIDGGTGLDILTDADFSLFTTNLVIDNSGSTLSFANGLNIQGIEVFSDLRLGSGDDLVSFSLTSDESIDGGAGNDTIYGAGGNDIIFGGYGDDVIKSTSGYDTVDGGSGDDILVVDYAANSFIGSADYLPGISGSYVAEDPATGSFSGYFYAYNNSSGGFDEVDFTGIERFQITATNFADTLTGGFGNDTLNASGGSDYINAQGGIDSIDGGAGIDVLEEADFSAQTTDLIVDNSGATLIGTNGTVVTGVELFKNLYTGSGNDRILYTVRSNDTIDAGGGNDVINAGLGQDVVYASGGTDDLLIVDYSGNTFGGLSYTDPYFSEEPDPSSGEIWFEGYRGTIQANTNSSGDYNSVTFFDVDRFQITGTKFADTLLGGAG